MVYRNGFVEKEINMRPTPIPDVETIGMPEWFHYIEATQTKPSVCKLFIHESTPGPAIILRDVASRDYDALSTDKLTGCMCLAIIGENANGTTDVFFCHASHYDKEEAIHDVKNPIHHARAFVQSHPKVRVMWGTGFNASSDTISIDKAQHLLSHALGVYVHRADSFNSRSMTFFPKDRIVCPKDFDAAVGVRKEGSQEPLRCYAKFSPERVMVMKIKLQLEHAMVLQPSSTAMAGFAHSIAGIKAYQEIYEKAPLSRRPKATVPSMKAKLIMALQEAYIHGDMDALQQIKQSANDSSVPSFMSATDTIPWDSALKALVDETCQNAEQIYRTRDDESEGDGMSIRHQ